MLNRAIKAKNLYEFDLKEFFPSVNIETVTSILQEYKVPKGLSYFIENINRVTPQLPEDRKLDETVIEDRYKVHTSLKAGVYDPSQSIYEELKHPNFSPELIKELMEEDGEENVFE